MINHFVEMPDAQAPPDGRDGFVFAGRLSHEKGVDTLIRAMAAMVQPAQLHIAGDGPERAALEALAAEVAPGQVRFHGRPDKLALQALVASCVASVVPSRWNENQPMTILESYAAQVPVVVTGLGGCPSSSATVLTAWWCRWRTRGALPPPSTPRALHPRGPRRWAAWGVSVFSREFDAGLHLRRLEAAYRGEGTDGGTAVAVAHEGRR